MSDRVKITELTTLSSIADADWVPVVDISDTTDGPDGTTKKVAKSALKGLNWQGAWSAGSYVADDAVEHNGTSYVANTATSEEPGTGSDWDTLAAKGDTGATGATGAAGATGPAGADGDPGLDWQGTWSAGTYTIKQGVFYNGSSYICVAASTTGTPGVSADWELLAQQGAAGSGSGDMVAATYDPTNVMGDVFDQDNMVDGTTNKNYTATEKTKLAGVETAADVTDAGNVGSSINGATAKTTPVDADTMALIDSAASNVLKKVTWANIKATLGSTFAALAGSVSQAFSAASIELGHASDTTLSRSAAGQLAVEGVDVLTTSNTKTMTNKTMTATSNVVEEITTTTSSATPTPTGGSLRNFFTVTALATNPTFAAPSGTAANGNKLTIRIKDDGTGRTLAWNAIYRAIGVTLPTATTANKTIYVGLIYNSADTKWDAVAVATEA